MQQMLEHDGEGEMAGGGTLSTENVRPVRPKGVLDTLEIQVLRARKLLAADLDGLADPLVYCWLAPMWSPEGFIPEHTQRAFTDHCPKTLDPNWMVGSMLPPPFEFEVKDEFWGVSVAV